jgi:putative transposase
MGAGPGETTDDLVRDMIEVLTLMCARFVQSGDACADGGQTGTGCGRMIVQMRTRKQAARVAELTRGVQLAGKPKPDGTETLSGYVDVGADFEARRAAVESVSVLFDLYNGDAAGYTTGGSPGEPLPNGWTVIAAKFEVEWPTDPQRTALVRSHFGARRFAFNWGLGQVKADLDAKALDLAHESVNWDLGSLRKAWNRAKNDVAPWWAENSKECYSSGLADLAQGLANWRASTTGTPARVAV